MNFFTLFFYKILEKYSPKRTKLHHLKTFSRGSICPRTPLTDAWLSHANSSESSQMKMLKF